MANKKFVIRSKILIEDKEAIGVTIDSATKSLEDLKQLYIDRKIVFKNGISKLEGTVISIDGYRANSDFSKINLFLMTDIDSLEDFKTGDTIEVYLT